MTDPPAQNMPFGLAQGTLGTSHRAQFFGSPLPADVPMLYRLAAGVHFSDLGLFSISVFKTIGQPVAFFRPPDGNPLLKPGPPLRRYPWKNVVFLQSRKRF
jgi:hypothetical protein